MLLSRGGQNQSPRNGTVQHKQSSSAPLLLVVRGLQWRRHLTRSVAAVEILQSRPLLLAGVQPKGGHIKHLQGDCGTLGLGMASLYEGKGQPTELQRRRHRGWRYAGRCSHRSLHSPPGGPRRHPLISCRQGSCTPPHIFSAPASIAGLP